MRSRNNGPPTSAILLLLTERRRQSPGRLVEIGARVQALVVAEHEAAATELIGAALGRDIHDRAGGPAELGRELVRDQPHFLHDVRVVDLLLTAGDARIVAVLAVDHEVVRANAHAVRREIRPGCEDRLAAPELTDAGGGQRERKHIATVHDRQIGDAAGIEPHPDFGVRRVQQRGIGSHFDALRHRRGPQLDVDDRVLVQREGDT